MRRDRTRAFSAGSGADVRIRQGRNPRETGRARRSEDYGNCRFPVETVGCHGRKHPLGETVGPTLRHLLDANRSLVVCDHGSSSSTFDLCHAKAAPSPCSPVQTSSSAMRARSVSVPRPPRDQPWSKSGGLLNYLLAWVITAPSMSLFYR
jgi:hypothetical protein